MGWQAEIDRDHHHARNMQKSVILSEPQLGIAADIDRYRCS